VITKEIDMRAKTIVRGLYPRFERHRTKIPTEPHMHPAKMTAIGAIREAENFMIVL
jgi:hypothetical protein